MPTKLIQTKDYLLLIDEEAEIKEGWKGYAYKKDVVDEVFKHSYTENTWYDDAKIVIAYYPLTKEAKELDLPLLPNPFEEDVLLSYINKLENERFDGWTNDEIKGYKTALISVSEFYKAAQSKQLENFIKTFNDRKMEKQKEKLEYKDFTGNDVKPLVSRSLVELKELQRFCSAKMARYIGSPFFRERWYRH